MAQSYNNVGVVYSEKDDNEKALEYYNKSLAIRLNTSGENHPHVAAAYNNISHVYKAKGDDEIEKALEYHTKSLAIKLNTLGENHSNGICSLQ